MGKRGGNISFRKLISLIVLTCLLNGFAVCEQSETFGPYYGELREIGPCSKEIVTTNQIQFDTLKPKRINGGIALTGNITFLIPFSNDLRGILDLSKFGNGGWKSHFFQTEIENACDGFINLLPEFKEDLATRFNASGCPYPAGVYDWTGYKFPRTIKSVPAYHYGKYKAEGKLLLNHEIVGCFTITYDVLPKIKRNG